MYCILGGKGFVGSAFGRLFKRLDVPFIGVQKDTYSRYKGREWDIVVNASNNSQKFLADQDPLREFELSTLNTMRILCDFPADLFIQISSVDVYSDLVSPLSTSEKTQPDIRRSSHYGFHKYLAEECVRHYARHWLIVRLAGMVGPNLKKNPVYDILHDQPLRIHPDSLYQFMTTDRVAEIVWLLVEKGWTEEVVNVCGRGLISPRQVAMLAKRQLDLSLLPSDAQPRIVDINIDKISALVDLPDTQKTIEEFIKPGLDIGE